MGQDGGLGEEGAEGGSGKDVIEGGGAESAAWWGFVGADSEIVDAVGGAESSVDDLE